MTASAAGRKACCMDRGKAKFGTEAGGAGPSAKEAREAKLAQALRDNLRRRKGAPTRPPAESPGDADKD